jgi:hypothetical protein
MSLAMSLALSMSMAADGPRQQVAPCAPAAPVPSRRMTIVPTGSAS